MLMNKNYFFLNRLALELNEELENCSLVMAFAQEKNKLVLEFKGKETSRYLEVFVEPGFPYINLKDAFSRAKKNTVDFFKEYLPSKLKKIEIAENDRIVKFTFEIFSIYFTIRGKYTNLHLVDDKGKILSFKNEEKEVENKFLVELKHHSFINNFNTMETLSGQSSLTAEKMRQLFPIIGKDIIMEAQRRKSDLGPTVEQIIAETSNKPVSVFIDESADDVHIAPSTFGIFPYEKKKEFTHLTEALNFFLSKHYFMDDFMRGKNIIEKHISKELEKTSSKINRLRNQLDKKSREEEYHNIGNLLLININSIRKGMDKIEVEDIYSGQSSVSIKLKPDFSPRKNADYYFDKARNEKISIEKSRKLLKSAEAEFKKLSSKRELLTKCETIEEINELMKELNIKEKNQKPDKEAIKIKFKHYLLDGKYHLYVGRDSRNNDLLTTKFAKQNDYWFHARGVSGSHAVLRVNNTNEAVPKNILKSAASIAAFHSKAKTAGIVPVSYTFKKYVIKKKGMEPGKVALLKEETLLVHPEIPKNCEYLTEE
jgi:predicted ribosome quality control (RQC) complex YloA/Tae2 family protein